MNDCDLRALALDQKHFDLLTNEKKSFCPWAVSANAKYVNVISPNEFKNSCQNIADMGRMPLNLFK